MFSKHGPEQHMLGSCLLQSRCSNRYSVGFSIALLTYIVLSVWVCMLLWSPYIPFTTDAAFPDVSAANYIGTNPPPYHQRLNRVQRTSWMVFPENTASVFPKKNLKFIWPENHFASVHLKWFPPQNHDVFKIKGIQWLFSALSYAHFFRNSQSFGDIMHCGWWDIHSFPLRNIISPDLKTVPQFL